MSELREVADAIDAQAPGPRCVNHPDRPAPHNLDGDDLCRDCADDWARAEGQWAAEMEEHERAAHGG